MYKVEKYLDRCVESIVSQTYSNLEIILVDDGSPDNCPAMCDVWAQRDSRVRVIHKNNGGPDTARNAGLDAARGEYIGTIDSDDFIAPNMYERLYALLTENDADMSMCEFVQVDEDGRRLDEQEAPMKDEIISREQMFKYTAERFITANHCFTWNRLHRAEIFRNLRFIGGLHEDLGTTHRIIGKCRRIAVSSEPLYFYRKRQNSTTGKLSQNVFRYKSFKNLMESWNDRYEYFMEINRPDAADTGLVGIITTLRYAFDHVNYFQFRDELRDSIHETIRRILASKGLRRKLRIIKFALAWFRSIFRPFIDKEKLL